MVSTWVKGLIQEALIEVQRDGVKIEPKTVADLMERDHWQIRDAAVQEKLTLPTFIAIEMLHMDLLSPELAADREYDKHNAQKVELAG